jgi:hypothetical protein
MLDKIASALQPYPDAVLTGFDAQGYPFSQRCKPQIDSALQALRIAPFGEATLTPGPASLLCHSYNQEVWNLSSVQVLGQLERAETGWIFRPERLLAGMGSSPTDQIKMLSEGRAAAKKYLEKRSLPRPKVAWNEFIALQKEGKKRYQSGKQP